MRMNSGLGSSADLDSGPPEGALPPPVRCGLGPGNSQLRVHEGIPSSGAPVSWTRRARMASTREKGILELGRRLVAEALEWKGRGS